MYSNLFYFRKISKIGGTEQYLYEIAKKYHDLDIIIFYDEADKYQLKRLKKYVKCRKRKPNEKIVCKRAWFNFNIDMIDDVESTENYYGFVGHANWEELGYKPPVDHPKLNHFIGVSQFSTDKLDEWLDMLKIGVKAEKCYNPLTLEEVKKPKIIVSACRLDDEVKGGTRTLKLINSLDKYCEEHPEEHYLWLIFTNPGVEVELNSPNVCLMNPRIDVRPYIAMADYIAQLSNDMETYCYTLNEGLGYGIPVIATPLSILKELPITDNEKIILNWDCSNADLVAKEIFEKEVKPFKYQIPKDNWKNLLVNDKSTYREDKIKKYLVRTTDMWRKLHIVLNEEGIIPDKDFEFIVDGDRLEELLDNPYGQVFVEVIKEIKDDKSNKNTRNNNVSSNKSK